MKRKVIHIPKGGLPAWKLAEDPDTVWHARARILFYGVLIATYATLVVASFMGKVNLSWARGVLLGYFFLLGLPTIHYGIRPGKGKAWLITLGVLVLVYFVPPLIIIAPLAMLGVQMWHSTHPKKEQKAQQMHAEATSETAPCAASEASDA
jgi:hypothetical protein